MRGDLEDEAHQPYRKAGNRWVKKQSLMLPVYENNDTAIKERTLPPRGAFSPEERERRHYVAKPSVSNRFAPPDEGGGRNYPWGRGLPAGGHSTRVPGFEEHVTALVTDLSRNAPWRGATSLAQEHRWKGGLRAAPMSYEPCYEPCSSATADPRPVSRSIFSFEEAEEWAATPPAAAGAAEPFWVAPVLLIAPEVLGIEPWSVPPFEHRISETWLRYGRDSRSAERSRSGNAPVLPQQEGTALREEHGNNAARMIYRADEGTSFVEPYTHGSLTCPKKITGAKGSRATHGRERRWQPLKRGASRAWPAPGASSDSSVIRASLRTADVVSFTMFAPRQCHMAAGALLDSHDSRTHRPPLHAHLARRATGVGSRQR